MQVEITIPQSWGDITIERFKDIDFNDIKQMLSRLIGLTLEQVNDLSPESIILLLEELEWIFHLPKPEFKKEIELDDKKYYLVDDYFSLSVSELVDLEEWCSNFQKNIHYIAAWLYRDNTPYSKKNIEERAKVMLNFTMDHLYGAMIHALAVEAILEYQLIDFAKNTL